jgi:hypothetical protein
MSHSLTHHTPAFTPPGIAQWLGRRPLVPGSRRSPCRQAHLAAVPPPIPSTQPLLAFWQAIQPGLPTCPLLWGQASTAYFPL